jgi:tetratricopeptide (TPR) repeat protein
MAYLIPLIIIVLSFAGIAGLFVRRARAIPKSGGSSLVYPNFEDRTAKEAEAKPGRSLPWGLLKMLPMGEKETFFLSLEKFFRKLRIHLMRMENWLTSVANRLHERTARRRGVKQPPASFISFNNESTEFDETYWINVLKQNRESPYPYKKLGEIYLAREDFQEARSSFKYALKLDPSDKEAAAKLAELRGKRTKKK